MLHIQEYQLLRYFCRWSTYRSQRISARYVAFSRILNRTVPFRAGVREEDVFRQLQASPTDYISLWKAADDGVQVPARQTDKALIWAESERLRWRVEGRDIWSGDWGQTVLFPVHKGSRRITGGEYNKQHHPEIVPPVITHLHIPYAADHMSVLLYSLIEYIISIMHLEERLAVVKGCLEEGGSILFKNINSNRNPSDSNLLKTCYYHIKSLN